MKRTINILLILFSLFCFASCTKSDDNKKEILSQAKDSSAIDIDLTNMSKTVVYSEVYNMMQNPDEYENKIIKMKGLFSTSEGESRRYYTCFITDAAACCKQGVEFTLKDEKKYPDDYPEPGDEITVVGTFETYTEGNKKYFQLKNASFTD